VVPFCAFALVAGLVLESSAACPTTNQVQPRVTALLANTLGAPLASAGRIAVAREGPELVVTRTTADGSVLERRTLPLREGSCEAAADDVAVVIAAMLTEFQPAWTVALEPAPSAPMGLRAAGLAFGPVVPLGSASRAWRLSAEVDIGSAARAWAIAVSAFFEGGESVDLGAGHADVRRGGGALGLVLGTRMGAWTAVARGEAGLALTAVTGRGYSRDSTSFSGDPVVLAGFEGGRAFGRVAVSVGPFVEWWPRAQSIRVMNVTDVIDLPGLQAFLRLGLSYR
jgi:hypothetical protein